METRKELLEMTKNLATNAGHTKLISDFQIRTANSLLAFVLSDDQLAEIDRIINE